MSNVLTPQIAGMYLGAKIAVVYPSNNFPQYEVCNLSYLIKLHNKTEELATNWKWNKLLLTPLSEITDEDAVEVSKLNGIRSDNIPIMEYLGRGLVLFHFCDISPFGQSNFDSVQTRDSITTCAPAFANEILKYLREKSYDCDNLIAQGIAIPNLKTSSNEL